MRPTYRLHGRVVVRLGVLTAAAGRAILEAVATGEGPEILRLLALHPAFEAAVANAAPEFMARLQEALRAGRAGRKDLHTLGRYVLRATHRATPFGLFAAVGVASTTGPRSLFGPGGIGFRPSWRRIAEAEPAGRPELHAPLRLNPSAYRWEDSVRFLERAPQPARRTFQISTVELSPEVDFLFDLLTEGRSEPWQTLVDRFQAWAPGYDAEDVQSFLADLCEAGLLLVDRPAAAAAPAPSVVPSMARRPGAGPHVQVNLIAGLQDLAVHQSSPVDCSMVLPYLALLGEGSTAGLEAFKRRFRDKYENARVPLLEALDADLGVTPEADTASPQGGAAAAGQGVELQPLHVELLRLLDAARGGPVNLLDSSSLRALAADAAHQLPPTVGVLYELPPDEGGAVFIKGAAPTPAARWMSRFALDDPELGTLYADLCRLENEALAGYVVAEIVYGLPGREAGIADRPHCRPYALRMFAAGSDAAQDLSLRELELALRGEQLVLWSPKLGRPVLPLLTSAHNHQQGADPVSSFLCELQQQAFASLGSGWGPLRRLRRHLPRLTVGRFVISPETWRLDRADIEHVCSAADSEDFLRRLRARVFAGQPVERLALVQLDNWLHLDLTRPGIPDILRSSLQRLDSAVLAEPCPGRRAGPDGGHSTELLAFYVREPAPQPAVPGPPGHERAPAAAALSLLDGLVYLELYAADRAIDELVCQRLQQAIAALPENCRPARWFFVRYGAPRFHLRLRLFSDPPPVATALLGALVQALGLARAHRGPYEWKLACYERETGRYGGPELMALAEDMFCAHSAFVCACLREPDWAGGTDARLALAVGSCAAVFRALLPGPAALAMLSAQVPAMEVATRADKGWRKDAGETYRARRAELQRAVSGSWRLDATQREAFEAFEAAGRAYAAQARAQDRGDGLQGWAGVHAHMCCNRIFAVPTMELELQVLDLCRRALLELRSVAP